MFSTIYNWILGRILVKCAYCGDEEYISATSNNPHTIYCCSNRCSYQYYQKYCIPTSPYYKMEYDNATRIEIV